MVTLKRIASAGLVITGALSAPVPTWSDWDTTAQCGKVNIFFEGLPPYHPLVIAQGYDPALVEKSLRQDQARILAAGYNLLGIFVGPEVNKSVLRDRLSQHHWDASVTGFGVRGAAREDLTIEFTELVKLFHEEIDGPALYNYSPNSTLWAIQRHFPILADCAGSPGQDLGFEVVCDLSVCSRNVI